MHQSDSLRRSERLSLIERSRRAKGRLFSRPMSAALDYVSLASPPSVYAVAVLVECLANAQAKARTSDGTASGRSSAAADRRDQGDAHDMRVISGIHSNRKHFWGL